MSGKMIEDLDRLTSKYESSEDLLISYPEEVWDTNIRMYDPVIIVDKNEFDRSKLKNFQKVIFHILL